MQRLFFLSYFFLIATAVSSYGDNTQSQMIKGNINILQSNLTSKLPGEETTYFDINFDGKKELLLFPSSQRSAFRPDQNDVAIYTLSSSGELVPNFVFIPVEGYRWTSEITSNADINDFKSGWLQNIEIADFDEDGLPDLFFAGHGNEWVRGYEEWSDVIEDVLSGKAKFPGDYLRILLSNNGFPKIVRLNNDPYFAHSSKVGDFNGDGHYDVISTDFRIGPGETTLTYFGDGSGKFSVKKTSDFRAETLEGISLGYSKTDEILVGLNGLVSSQKNRGNLEIWAWKTHGLRYLASIYIDTLALEDLVGRPLKNNELSIDKINDADLDADGDYDFIIKIMDEDGYLATIAFFNNLGTFNQVPVDINYVGKERGQLGGGNGPNVVDINSDGLLDVIATGWIGNLNDPTVFAKYVYINLGEENGFVPLANFYEFELTDTIDRNRKELTALILPQNAETPQVGLIYGNDDVFVDGKAQGFEALRLFILELDNIPPADELIEACRDGSLNFCPQKLPKVVSEDPLEIQKALIRHCPTLGRKWVSGRMNNKVKQAAREFMDAYGLKTTALSDTEFLERLYGPSDGRLECMG